MTSARHRCFSLLMAKDQFTSPMTSHYDTTYLLTYCVKLTCICFVRWHQTVGIAFISYFLPQKFCPWSLETIAVYLPYPSVIITCTNILLFLEICFFLLIERMFGDILVLISLLMLCYAFNLLMAVWLSGNALASINVVALRQTRLVLGWVTVCGRVNHFGM